MEKTALLPDRAVISVTGADRVSFLQGLVSNDVTLAAPGRAIWAALLSPQGKWRADFFILDGGERLLLDVERGQADELIATLTRFRLRAKVELAIAPLRVLAAWDVGDGTPASAGPEAIAAPDPRLPEAGWRILVPDSTEPGPDAVDDIDWDRHRLLLGLPDGSRDLERDRTVLLEAGFDELNGISWTKGCYMGQELTARTRYRGLVKRRLVPVSFEGAAPAPATPILHEGIEVGSVRSSRDGLGLALLRITDLHAPLYVDDHHRVCVHLPDWMRLPEASS
jgi:tRNA-modifying protein YgfZ